ncbi:gustatory receptor for sugar taste 64f-like [Euwallacea fornicatus]|uniref:gustatory receptor for sugar taste 64f-like n=1 Tax=Euwallacea fornicatus TaxID=995702 RepID=UPI00338D784B
MQLNKALRSKMSIDQIDYIAKYLSASYVAIVFIELAKKWPKLIESWRQVEIDMKGYGFPKKLNKKISILMLFFMGTFLVEYILHQTTRIFRAVECHDDLEKSLKFFFSNLTLSHVFHYIPYNIPSSLVFQYWFCQLEFAFTYTDIFVMVISMCLASRMQQVTERIKITSQKQVANEKIWKKLRKDYTRLETLVELVNKNISNIILVSFLPNIFTILTQVFSALKPKHNWVESVYFYVSLVFLVSRTIMVCICGAMVNEESRKPLYYLNSVHYTIYNEEIEIFINQLLNFEISMNGKHFFDIKRYVILELAGAIVTYELVLIQFNQKSLNSESKSTRCI